MKDFDAFKELTGGKVVKITGAYVFPAIDGMIIENNGRFYKLTSEKLIDIEEIGLTDKDAARVKLEREKEELEQRLKEINAGFKLIDKLE